MLILFIFCSNTPVPCVTYACIKITFGSVSNLSNDGNFFINVVRFMISQKRKGYFILFIFGTIINHNRGLMHVKYTLALCQNVAFMSISCINCMCL